MANPESWRKVDEVRALILAEIIRKDYLEELLENNRLHVTKTAMKTRQRKQNGASKIQEMP